MDQAAARLTRQQHRHAIALATYRGARKAECGAYARTTGELAWYDNEIGYVNRMMELARKVAQNLR